MKGIRELTKQEVKALNNARVVTLYSDFDEKVNGHKSRYSGDPFLLTTAVTGDRKWYTNDDGLVIALYERTVNTWIDFICKGYTEIDARKMATNDTVLVTSIFKIVE